MRDTRRLKTHKPPNGDEERQQAAAEKELAKTKHPHANVGLTFITFHGICVRLCSYIINHVRMQP